MTAWSDWEWLVSVGPWIGAALLLLAGFLATLGVWARWQPVPSDGPGGMPWLMRWCPAITLGAGCAAVIWLVTPQLEPEVRAGTAAVSLATVAILCAVWLGRAGDRAVRRMLESDYWKLSAEGVATRLRRLLQKDEMLGYAAKKMMAEMEATEVRVLLLEGDRFELAAGLPTNVSPLEPFEKECLLAKALSSAQSTPFLVVVNPATVRPGDWSKHLKDVDASDVQAEQRRLESIEVQAVVGIWRESQLAGFFLIGGRLTSIPLNAAQKQFAAEIAREVGRMLEVVEGAEKLARERSVESRADTDREMATAVRRLMALPDGVAVTGLEYGVSVEIVEGSYAGFCDAMVLPGSALGIVMAETSTCGLQAAGEMVRLQALLRSRFYVYGEDLREMLESVERVLSATEGARQPIQLLVGRYDTAGRRFVYVNAGYEPPILLKNRSDGSEARRLAATGRPLSGEGPANWEVEEFELRRRDLLLAISPGLFSNPDAMEKWGEKRLLETMLELEKQHAPAIALGLVREAAACKSDDQPKHERSVIAIRPSDAAVRLLSMPPDENG